MPPLQHSDRRVSEGTRIHWLWREENSFFYNHESVFVSREIRERYEAKKSSLQFVETTLPRTIVEDEEAEFNITFTSFEDSIEAIIAESEALQSVLDQEQVPEAEQRSTLFTQNFLSAFESNDIANIFGIISRGATSDNGTVDELDQEEDNLREKHADLDTRSNSKLYSGPLFLYSKDSERDQTILEREAPINLAWKNPLGCKGISLSKRMETNGWKGIYNHSPATRYAIVHGNRRRIRTHGDEAAKRKGLPLKQLHIRMVEVPYTMDSTHIVAGGAHRDPWLHGKISKHIRDPNWKFTQARQETLRDWNEWGYPTASVDAGNENNGSSSKGKIGVIKPL